MNEMTKQFLGAWGCFYWTLMFILGMVLGLEKGILNIKIIPMALVWSFLMALMSCAATVVVTPARKLRELGIILPMAMLGAGILFFFSPFRKKLYHAILLQSPETLEMLAIIFGPALLYIAGDAMRRRFKKNGE